MFALQPPRHTSTLHFRFTTHADDPDLEGEKRKKTKFSTRDTPIHQGLLDLEFVKWAQDQPKGPLFPHPYDSNDTFARMYSKQYRGYLEKIALKRSGLAMHSFRHGFATASRMAGLPDEIHNALTGRSQKGVGQQYGQQKRKLEFLQEQINRIQFDLPKSTTQVGF